MSILERKLVDKDMTNGIGGGIIFDYLFMHFLNLVYEIGNQSAFLEVDLLNNSSQEI